MLQKLVYAIKELANSLGEKKTRVCPAWSWRADEKKNICTLIMPNGLLTSYKKSPSPCTSGNCVILEELSMCWPNVRNPSFYNSKLVPKALKFYKKVTGDDI